MEEIKLTIESDIIKAQTRKLKAHWSLEAEQDLRWQHNLNIESILWREIALTFAIEEQRMLMQQFLEMEAQLNQLNKLF